MKECIKVSSGFIYNAIYKVCKIYHTDKFLAKVRYCNIFMVFNFTNLLQDFFIHDYFPPDWSVSFNCVRMYLIVKGYVSIHNFLQCLGKLFLQIEIVFYETPSPSMLFRKVNQICLYGYLLDLNILFDYLHGAARIFLHLIHMKYFKLY